MPKRTLQKSKTRRRNTHGFRVRIKTAKGQKILSAKRQKGKHKLAS